MLLEKVQQNLAQYTLVKVRLVHKIYKDLLRITMMNEAFIRESPSLLSHTLASTLLTLTNCSIS